MDDYRPEERAAEEAQPEEVKKENRPEAEGGAPEGGEPVVEERDATLDEDRTPYLSADELQDTLLEDSGMNAFQKFCARLDDAKWTLLQRVAGALMGVAAGVSLFWDTLVRTEQSEQQSGIFSLPLVIAIMIALILPNVIEKQSLRRVPKLRIAMVISLAAVIVIYFIVVGVQSGFRFSS